MRAGALICALLLVSTQLLGVVQAVDRSKFKTCSQSSFCRRHRDLPKVKGAVAYTIDQSSLVLSGSEVTATITETRSNVQLKLRLIRYENNIVRVKIVEQNPLRPRYEVKDSILENQIKTVPFESVDQATGTVFLDAAAGHFLKVHFSAARLELFFNRERVVSTNAQDLFYFEHQRVRETPAAPAVVPEPVVPTDEAGRVIEPSAEQAVDSQTVSGDILHQEVGHESEEVLGMVMTTADAVQNDTKAAQDTPAQPDTPQIDMRDAWDETYSSHRDSKPFGPTSVGLDFTFYGTNNVYGIPEHADNFNLRPTRGEGINRDPYRLYNLDVFEYELDTEMALYGAVPFMVAHGPKQTTGLLWLNAAETWIDVAKPNATSAASNGGMFDWILGKGEGRDPAFPSRVETHWFSESGALEFFLLPGPRPIDVTTQYGYLTGGQQLPPSFAIGYHQCRWNYINEADVAAVNKGFEEHNLPMDVLWLDIEHTDNKKYFTWHSHQFPTPDKMQREIKSFGRKMVTIIDPHIKREDGYYVHSEATKNGLYVKNVDNQGDYEGWCWPGSSSWLDFFRPEVRQWWAEQYSFDKYKGSTDILYTWNDMNEPSVFNGPEVTMHKDAKHLGGQFEHRDVHNQYGFYMQMATVDGQLQRNSHRTRAFVLTRSFFAGSQRYGAVWTGDNTATWGHLKASIPMILSLNIAGIQFAGADVGGFFNNPDAQLLTRWYQAGAFSPFFREHAHIDTKRREPWLFGEPYLSIIREALRLRYSLLPYWYTLFEDASRTLTPVNRPLWFEFPSDSNTFGLEEDFLVGPHLLVHPITDADTNSAQVFLPSGSVWYDWYSHERHVGQGSKITVNAPLERIPILIRGGGIIPLKTRARRSTAAMVNDPYTLIVALDDVHKSAKGSLYTDDGESFNFQKGQFIRRHFTYTTEGSSASLSSAIEGTWASTNTVERIVILGVDKAPSKVSVSTTGAADRTLEFNFDSSSKTLTVRKPNTKISEQWTIHFTF